MNSRQRRKLEAANHNMLRIEEEAYLQDRLEDPDKYKRKYRSPGVRGRSRVPLALITAATLGMSL